jgi:hypothetical protein
MVSAFANMELGVSHFVSTMSVYSDSKRCTINRKAYVGQLCYKTWHDSGGIKACPFAFVFQL